MIIGLCGYNAAGKSEVANILKEKNYTYFSLSDVIRDETKKRNLELSRENLVNIGNELREKFGANILAKRIIEKVNEELNKGKRDFVIDSIRNVKEVEELKKMNEFILLGVNASIELRFERAKKRGRNENALTLKEFEEQEKKELLGNENAQQLDKVYKLSDKLIYNDSTIEDLKKKIDFVLKFNIKKRLTWDEYFMKITSVVAERSTCWRHNVGAIIVKDKRILSTGYNGAVSGSEDCLKLGCRKDELNLESGFGSEDCRAVHAEQNAIVQAAKTGTNINDATLYCTTIPCRMCAKEIVNCGIKKVITYSDYLGAKGSIDFMKKNGIDFKVINRPENTINFKD